MSTESEDIEKSRSDGDDDAKIQELHKEATYAYERTFLLSLAEIDECKRLPIGFDSSFFCELNAAAATRSSHWFNDSESEAVAKSRLDDDDEIQKFHKETRYVYKRGFLLSLAEIDGCKKLPSGFDSSILCELNAAAATRSSQCFSDSESEDVSKSRSNDDHEIQELHKETRYAYKRGFLLSLAEIDECKRLPSGFDSSILCELNAAPAARSCWPYDPESGKKDDVQSLYSWANPVNELRRQNPTSASEHSWQNPANGQSRQNNANEHPQQNPADGVLGKGGLLRAPLCIVGSSAQKVRSCNLLKKSIAPYRPPHLYKMTLHSERESKDVKKCETSIFTDCPSHGRAEVERWRRGSSEWTRKEHENAVQENQNNISDEHKENLNPHVATLLNDSRNEERLFNKCSQAEKRVPSPTPIDATPNSSTESTIISKLSPSAQGRLNKCNESDECTVLSNPNDARPCSSAQISLSKLLPHELMRKSSEQNFETKFDKKGNQHELTSPQLVSDDHVSITFDFLYEEESELNTVSDYDEICLPDEDSLITSDDFKLPTDLVSFPESSVTETDLFASSKRMQGNVSQVLAALSVPLDERSRSSLEVPTTISVSDDKIGSGSGTSHGNLHAGQCFPQSRSQTNQGSTLLCPSDSEKRPRRSNFKPHLKSHSYSHPPIGYIPVYLLPDCFLDPYAASTSFDIPVIQPSSQQILAPVEFPHQVNGLSSGPSYPPFNGPASYSQGPGQMQTSPLNSCQQTYKSFTMPNPGANSNPAAINSRLPETNHTAKQMHPGWPWTGNVQQFGQ